jgi:hypothetical protein
LSISGLLLFLCSDKSHKYFLCWVICNGKYPFDDPRYVGPEFCMIHKRVDIAIYLILPQYKKYLVIFFSFISAQRLRHHDLHIETSLPKLVAMFRNCQIFPHDGFLNRDRCYDFLNIFAEKFSEKIGVFCSN